MKKAVFFDADGTVTDMRTGTPDSAIHAIRRCRENGHLVFLCTGRSRALITSELLDIGFDGIIASAGAYLEKEGQILYNKEMTSEEALDSLRILKKYGLIPLMEGKDYMYFDPEDFTEQVEWTAPYITRILGDRAKPIRGNEHDMHINKISAKIVPGSNPQKAIQEMKKYYDVVVHEGGAFPGTIEFMPKEYSKALGIAIVCRAWGIAHEDMIAFGDSSNDMEMFSYAHTKVAMGNAPDSLKAMADYITTDMYHYGIRDGLRKLELI